MFSIAILVGTIATIFLLILFLIRLFLDQQIPILSPIDFFVICQIMLGFAESICVTEFPFEIKNTEMEGQVNIFVWTCIMAGFILAFPYILMAILEIH